MLSIASTSLFLALEGADWQQIIVLLLFLFFGLGKAILDKVRGPAPPARPGRRAGTPPSASPAGRRPAAIDVEPRDVRELWDEVAGAASAPAPGTERASVGVLQEELDPDPLGLDLLEVEEELPSHHEELFETHQATAGLPEGEFRPAPVHQIAAAPRTGPRPSYGAELHALIGDRDAWRRAIVLSEVLGTPVALRKSEQLPGLR